MFFRLSTHGWSKVSSFSTLKTVHVWHFTLRGNYGIKQNKGTYFKLINGWVHFRGFPPSVKTQCHSPITENQGRILFWRWICFWVIVSLSFKHQYNWLKSLHKKRLLKGNYSHLRKRPVRSDRSRPSWSGTKTEHNVIASIYKSWNAMTYWSFTFLFMF